jgi:hypothetical protein
LEGLATEDVGIGILWPKGKFSVRLEYFVGYLVLIWYNSPLFGMLYQEKSGNPGMGTVESISRSGELSKRLSKISSFPLKKIRIFISQQWMPI